MTLSWANALQSVPFTQNDKLSLILQRPLIMGASISGDYNALSPGKRLALNYSKKENIKTISCSGSKSSQIMMSFNEKDLVDRSIIIALDLFFWDSTLHSDNDAIQQIDRLIKAAQAHGIPLVIGEVPELVPGWQPSRIALNKEIKARCRSGNRCLMMPFDDLLKKIINDGYVLSKGYRYDLSELIPDGLHLNALGSDVVAEKLEIFLEAEL
ncbi:MAG: SGNH/GDSL hydrolase family protein [Bdellovibrionaceae bacterium]|nr:SGNH/GDSL hydrolase family protein [Bdellovibrio sp.]